MKHISFIAAILTLTVLAACITSVSPVAGPGNQVQNAVGTSITSVVENWAKSNLDVPYKDIEVKILKQDDAFATVEVHVLLRKSPDTDWDEYITSIELKKVGQEWRIDKAGQFISPVAEATASAVAFLEAVKTADLYGIFMLSASEGWAVGRLAGDSGCAILQYQHGAWRGVQIPVNVCPARTTLVDVWIVSQNEGWAVGYKKENENLESPIILHYSNGVWQVVPSPTNVSIHKLSMVSRDEGWAVGLSRDWSQGDKTTSVILHYRESQWNIEYTIPNTDINDIFMVSPTEGWAVGSYDTPDEEYDIALHYSNGKWEIQRLSGARLYLTAMHMTTPSEGWAVGLFGARHYHNGEWESVNIGPGPFYDIYMLNANEGWAAAYESSWPQGGWFVHYTDGNWSRVNTPNNAGVSDIFMLSPTDGWAVGVNGLLLHYQNGNWNQVSAEEQISSSTVRPTAISATPQLPQTSSSTNAQQIAFAVKDGMFTYLKVEGTNQDGKWATWETKDDNGVTIMLTKDYWWQGTVILNFDIINLGQRTCVLDYLREAPGSNIAAITYTEGQGCNGEGGSAQNATMVSSLVKYMTAEESYQVVEAAQYALDVRGCVEGIMTGFTSGLTGRILTIKDCSGAALYIINGILEKYYLQVTDK